MMQRNGNMVGMPIGFGPAMKFSESERQMRLDRLGLASRSVKDDSPWFAVRCRSGREVAVENNLEEIGIRSLVPMRKGPDLRRRHRVIPGQMMPVIHGYVLVQIEPQPLLLDAIKGVEHVIDVLGGCLTPRPMTASEVNHFRRMADRGQYDSERLCSIIVGVGEVVLITEGPFARCNATVVTPNSKKRGDVVVTVKMFGGDVPITIPLALLEKV